MNSSLNKPNRNSSWDNPNRDSSWNHPNRDSSWDNLNRDSSWNYPNRDSSWNSSNRNLNSNESNRNLNSNESNRDLCWNKANGNSNLNKAGSNSSLNKLNKNSMWKEPNKKMLIAMAASIIVLASVVSVFASNATNPSDSNNESGFLSKILASKDKSNKIANDYSDMEDSWNKSEAFNDIQTTNTENITTDVVTGGMSEDEIISSEDIVQDDMTETTGTMETTSIVDHTNTPVSTTTSAPISVSTSTPVSRPTVTPTDTPIYVPTSAPTVRPTAAPTVVPTVAPTVAPDPYAYLVTPYSRKDSSGKIVYILSNSDSKYYTAMELSSLTKQQLRFARNEIFARRGGKFTSADLQQYFNSRSWYTPIRNATEFEDSDMNAYEIANVKLLKSLE